MRCCDCEFRNRCDETEKVLTSFVKCYKRDLLLKEQKTQTNADKIRSMTDEELYDFLCSFASRYTDISSPCALRAKLFYVMEWLKQPAEEE